MRSLSLLSVLFFCLASAQSLQLVPVVGNLSRPLFLTYAPDGSGRLFVVEQGGTIRILQGTRLLPEPFLDISSLVSCCGERGLLGLAFHPQFRENGFFFVNYTNRDGDTVVARYRASGNRADPSSARVILTIDQPYANHNGGMIAFGPDGMLYIGTGDGGAAGDPLNAGQRLDTLLGKILRIDVNRSESGHPYAIPPDNPVLGGRRSEIWSYGWRNPWRFSFDRETGDLWVADVGQNAVEEVNLQPASSKGGENYGWRIMEGDRCYNPPQNCNREGLVMPVITYTHSQGQSITGGYRYRGRAMPAFQGAYFYGDYVSGRIWVATLQGGRWQSRELLKTDLNISSFGEDAEGELYVIDHRGAVYRLAQR
ncbi:Aldose sugar dehydrogenase YliI [Meiothermus luteus]|jgi:glucose/arabinose dehydrogenase|uniref:Aldose sugar dehydrogenase YliI n=1 Tax=Meiothermus luteus TaxID=2026184 RepID=A0A399EK74_9DEIN|nr:PQQ-dependent sugar dehydrogenase [Meiothermus luteus]RIH82762.1 Aldose sugar dehydrogenase YliI [Meiothermus luteus]RMH59035.1 MAG: glucose dehydrogenase [Deinococcota bacterium]